MMIKKKFAAICLICLSGCSNPYLSVSQLRVDRTYLASTSVHTPDPRQEKPPFGQRLIIDWRVPSEVLEKNPRICLHLFFRNYEEQVITYPIHKRFGTQQYFLLNEEYEEKKGLLTYKAEIVTDDNALYKEWKHQMWVNLITVGDEKVGEEFREDIENYAPPEEAPPQQYENEDEDEGTISRAEWADRINSSVVVQSMHGSVMDTAYLKEEGSSESS